MLKYDFIILQSETLKKNRYFMKWYSIKAAQTKWKDHSEKASEMSRMSSKAIVNIQLTMNHVSNKSLADLRVSLCANSKINEKPLLPENPSQLCLLYTKICISEKQNTHVVSSICMFSLERTETLSVTHTQTHPDIIPVGARC